MSRWWQIAMIALPCCVLSGFSPRVAAAVAVTHIDAVNMDLVGRKRISRTLFEYEYRVTFVNSGPAVRNVEALPRSSSSAVSPQNTLLLGDMPDAGPIVPDETLRLRIQRRTRFDPEALSWEFLVSGEPDIVASPPGLEFGDSLATCEVEQSLRIENTGGEDLIVNRLAFETDERFPTFRPNLRLGSGLAPWRLRPGEFRDGSVRYTPQDLETHTATYVIESNDPDTPRLEIPVNGTGFVIDYDNGVFFQNATENPKVDILVAVDKSGSMFDTIDAVVANIQSFVASLQDSGTDFHLAVTVADDGCVLGNLPFIDEDFEPAAAQLAVSDMIEPSVSGGANTERGYMLAEAALSPENAAPTGCNAGFLRDDARLDLVFVSDEPEQSQYSWPHYVEEFQALKADPEAVKIHAIAGDYPSGCRRLENGIVVDQAQAGTGYFEGTGALGGYYLSICTADWENELLLLAEGSAASFDSSFALGAGALASTIRVWVNGQELENGWQHLPFVSSSGRSDRIVFDRDAIPPDQATIVVNYAVVPTCEN